MSQGLAWASQAALHFQISSQVSLHGILKTHRLLAPQVSLLFRFAQMIGGMGSADGDQLADSAVFLEDQSQASLEMENQKLPTFRLANDISVSRKNSSSVSINVIRGQTAPPPATF